MKSPSVLRKLGKSLTFRSQKRRVASMKEDDDGVITVATERSVDPPAVVNIRKAKQAVQPAPLPNPSCYSSIHVLVNRARAQQGLPLLSRSQQLDQLASEKARELAHKDRIERTPRPELVIKLQADTAEENVQCGASIRVMYAVALIEKSKQNRRNMLSKKFNEMGTATALAKDGNLYMVQYFRFNPELQRKYEA